MQIISTDVYHGYYLVDNIDNPVKVIGYLARYLFSFPQGDDGLVGMVFFLSWALGPRLGHECAGAVERLSRPDPVPPWGGARFPVTVFSLPITHTWFTY